jgi:hypothetical protein
VGHEGPHAVPGAARRAEAALKASPEGLAAGFSYHFDRFFEGRYSFHSSFAYLSFTVE